MGYGSYESPTPDGTPMDRGYLVPDRCHAEGCRERIDRGLGYLCFRCTLYFCGAHLAWTDLAQECFAGENTQVCQGCADELEHAPAAADEA